MQLAAEFNFCFSGTEIDLAALYSKLIDDPIKVYSDQTASKYLKGRNSSYRSALKNSTQSSISEILTNTRSASINEMDEDFYVGNLRPDFWCADQYGRIFFKGEEKANLDHLGVAEKELTTKAFQMSYLAYGNMTSMFAYAAACDILKLYLIDSRGDKILTELKSYNLNEAICRERLIAHVLCICRLSNLMLSKSNQQLILDKEISRVDDKNTSTDKTFLFNQPAINVNSSNSSNSYNSYN